MPGQDEWPKYWSPDDGYPNYFMDGEYYVGTVPESWKTASANPSALHWYEYDEGDIGEGAISMPGYIPSTDTSPVQSKTYYYLLEEDDTMSETANAYSTYQTYLMYRTASTGSYDKLVDIKDYPDMLPDPNMLDATTLSDSMEKQIAGIKRMGDGYRFTANYTPANFTKVKALEGHQYDYALWLGGSTAGAPDGHNGKFAWKGDVRVGFPGKGVDEVQDMNITAIPSTDTEWSAT